MGSTITRINQQEVGIVERFGKFQKILDPGFYILMPFVQNVRYRHSLKEKSQKISAQTAITKDNVYLDIDGILYFQVEDPIKCSYGAKEPIDYTQTLSQSVMRSEIGKLDLDTTFRERESINNKILEVLNNATTDWGIKCNRYEIKDIKVSDNMKEILNLEAESERKKRAQIKESEGKMNSNINQAEGKKTAKILDAEAIAQEIYLTGNAVANRIDTLNAALSTEAGERAAKFNLADLYIKSLQKLGNEKKNLVIKANLNNPDEIIQKSLNIMENDIDKKSH